MLLKIGTQLKVSVRRVCLSLSSGYAYEPLEQLHDELLRPLAKRKTKGAFYRRWRLVSLDGSTLDVADEKRNQQAFGRPGASRGRGAFPQIRFVSLLENGTHVLFASRMGPYATGEITLAKQVLPALQKGMLCLTDRNFLGYSLWLQAGASGAKLLWRCAFRAGQPQKVGTIVDASPRRSAVVCDCH